jgi:hypothetical protein
MTLQPYVGRPEIQNYKAPCHVDTAHPQLYAEKIFRDALLRRVAWRFMPVNTRRRTRGTSPAVRAGDVLKGITSTLLNGKAPEEEGSGIGHVFETCAGPNRLRNARELCLDAWRMSNAAGRFEADQVVATGSPMVRLWVRRD